MTSGNRQPNWDIYESALLLEAVYNVENGKEAKRDAIKRVSLMLRCIGINRGFQVDDTFRNINGITFQYQSMEFSALGRTGTTHKTGSKIFDETVAMYKADKTRFDSILAAAYSLADATKTSTQDNNASKQNQDDMNTDFKGFLLSQGRKEESAEWIINNFILISEYAVEKKIITTPLLNMTNVKEFSKAVNNIQQNKFFRILKKDLYRFLLSYSKVFISFLRNPTTSKTAESISVPLKHEAAYIVTETDKALVDKYGGLFSQIYEVLKTNEKHVFLTAGQISEAVTSDPESVSEILRRASWAEKLSDGYILGRNTTKETNIEFDIELAFGDPSNVEKVVIENFRRGFRPTSIMDRNRFLSLYESLFGNSISSEALLNEVQQKCFRFDDRYFLPKALVSRTVAQEMADYLVNYFSSKEILFYNVLFSLYEEKFESYIYSPQMMTSFLKKVMMGTPLYYFETYCSIKADVKPDISAEVKDYLISMDAPCSYEMIYENFPHLNQRDIYNVLHYNNPDILGNSKVEYFHVNSAHISTSEAEAICSITKALLEHSRFVTCNEVMDSLKLSEPVLMERLDAKFSVLGIRRLLSYYLRPCFDVETGIVTSKGQKVSVIDAFADFAKTHNHFTVDDVQAFANYIGTVPYWDIICKHAVRINAQEFVFDDDIEFEVDGIDQAIDYYCADYITLKDIPSFSRFPSCGTPWNIYLLQQYTYRFSTQFKMLSLGFAKGYATGVIVKKQSGYSDFDSVIIDALEKTSITTSNDALDYLCNRGFISERRYKKHADLLKIALIRRNKS